MPISRRFSSFLALAVSLSTLVSLAAPSTAGVGVVRPVSPVTARPAAPARKPLARTKARAPHPVSKNKRRQASTAVSRRAKTAAAAKPVRPPQDELDNMSRLTLAPGVVHKCHRGRLNINILDVDLKRANVEVKPVLAGECFDTLAEVKSQANRVHALAAVNANYFKRDGTPLGTLIVDGEWVAGPLYERISMGLTADKHVYIDRPNLHGTIETSNPQVPSIWVNNVNQPRRTGSHLILYTRRWGQTVKMAYAGSLVAVDAQGRVVDKSEQSMSIPYGGFVLSDTKSGAISHLERGDSVYLQWQPRPERWHDVVDAVSGGPTLIRDGKLYVDCKDEHFRKTWTSNKIHARTAAGVTRDNHLILMTVEGIHSLWDVAKALHKLGCVDAMNLDGGGSTTMVVKGKTVTRNKDASQRRVATSLAILPASPDRPHPGVVKRPYVPAGDMTKLVADDAGFQESLVSEPDIADPMANSLSPAVLAQDLRPAPRSDLIPDTVEVPVAAVQDVLQESPPAKALKEKKSRKSGKSGPKESKRLEKVKGDGEQAQSRASASEGDKASVAGSRKKKGWFGWAKKLVP